MCDPSVSLSRVRFDSAEGLMLLAARMGYYDTLDKMTVTFGVPQSRVSEIVSVMEHYLHDKYADTLLFDLSRCVRAHKNVCFYQKYEQNHLHEC